MVVLIEIVGEGVRNKMIGDGVALESCVNAGARGGVVIVDIDNPLKNLFDHFFAFLFDLTVPSPG